VRYSVREKTRARGLRSCSRIMRRCRPPLSLVGCAVEEQIELQRRGLDSRVERGTEAVPRLALQPPVLISPAERTISSILAFSDTSSASARIRVPAPSRP
jgi:hypothetical protein